MKLYKKVSFWMILASAVNLIAMALLVRTLPDQVPTHFNINFEVDAMGSPWFLVTFPAITLLFSIYIAVELKLRGEKYANRKSLSIFSGAFVALFIAIGWVLYAMMGTGAQMGDKTEVPLDLVMGLGMSILFIIMGNYLPTVRQNRTFGIRVRATLNDEQVWNKAHRFGGRMFVIGGILSAICSLIGHFADLPWLIFAGLNVGIFGPMAVIFIYIAKIKRR